MQELYYELLDMHCYTMVITITQAFLSNLRNFLTYLRGLLNVDSKFRFKYYYPSLDLKDGQLNSNLHWNRKANWPAHGRCRRACNEGHIFATHLMGYSDCTSNFHDTNLSNPFNSACSAKAGPTPPPNPPCILVGKCPSLPPEGLPIILSMPACLRWLELTVSGAGSSTGRRVHLLMPGHPAQG